MNFVNDNRYFVVFALFIFIWILIMIGDFFDCRNFRLRLLAVIREKESVNVTIRGNIYEKGSNRN